MDKKNAARIGSKMFRRGFKRVAAKKRFGRIIKQAIPLGKVSR